jgi:hypothetical protein
VKRKVVKIRLKMNVPMKGGPAPTVAVVPVPESEMDALLLGRTAVRTFDQYVRNVCIVLLSINTLFASLGFGLHLVCIEDTFFIISPAKLPHQLMLSENKVQTQTVLTFIRVCNHT